MLRGLDLKAVVSRLHKSLPLVTLRGAWAAAAKRNHGLLRQCYMCRKFEAVDGTWRLMLVSEREKISHGLCPRCHPKEVNRIKAEVQGC
jgi:hypothetical protein